jgi:hypothetical protein
MSGNSFTNLFGPGIDVHETGCATGRLNTIVPAEAASIAILPSPHLLESEPGYAQLHIGGLPN